jgi:hypothetical protein
MVSSLPLLQTHIYLTSPYVQNCSAIHTPADKFYAPLDSGSKPPNPLVGKGPGGMIVDDSVLNGYSPLKINDRRCLYTGSI